MKRYAFANILLSGPCNLRCPDCIGRRLPSTPENLHRFPLVNFDGFIDALHRHGISQVSVTGANTDPQCYRYEAALLFALRRKRPGVRVSLHTNGVLALEKMDLFNAYDRATISFPSFRPETYRKMTGSSRPLPLAEILERAKIPVTVSVLVTEYNRPEVPEILRRFRQMGVRRVVLRRPYGSNAPFRFFPGLRPARIFGGNPVYQVDEMEVTLWDFSKTRLSCLNLYSDGLIADAYLISARTAPGPSTSGASESPPVRYDPSAGTWVPSIRSTGVTPLSSTNYRPAHSAY